MFQRVIILIIALAVSFCASAKKLIFPIERVALESDLIVIGKIISVEQGTYQFKVTEYIKGKGDSILTVKEFEEWLCEIRFASVEVGQHLFLFLSNRGKVKTLFNGSTGEIPIINDSVTLKYETSHFIGNTPIDLSASVTDFKQGISDFIHYFKSPADSYLKQMQIIKSCNKKQFEAFKKRNSFTKWLCKKIKKNYEIV